MQTALQELKAICDKNSFDIKSENGVEFIVIDYEVLQSLFAVCLKKERQQIADAYTTGQRGIIEVLGNELSQRGVAFTLGIADDDKEDGELYYSETFEK